MLYSPALNEILQTETTDKATIFKNLMRKAVLYCYSDDNKVLWSIDNFLDNVDVIDSNILKSGHYWSVSTKALRDGKMESFRLVAKPDLWVSGTISLPMLKGDIYFNTLKCHQDLAIKIDTFEICFTNLNSREKVPMDYWTKLKRLTGHVGNASDVTVKLFQDDATGSCWIQVGNKSNYGTCFEEALDKFEIEEDS